VLFTAALTSATLLVVRHSAQALVQRQIEQDARNAVLTIQGVQHQREMMLSRRADLLATLAYVRNGDATTIKDASQNPGNSAIATSEHTEELAAHQIEFLPAEDQVVRC